MAYPMARTADAGVQVQYLLLQEFTNIATGALNKSGQPKFRNETAHIHEALAVLQGEQYRTLLQTSRSAVHSMNCLRTVINEPPLPVPPIPRAVANPSGDSARDRLTNLQMPCQQSSVLLTANQSAAPNRPPSEVTYLRSFAPTGYLSSTLWMPCKNNVHRIAAPSAAPIGPLPVVASPGWIEWMVGKVVEAGAAVRDGAVAGGTMAYDSTASLLQNLWMQEGLTPEERQEIIGAIEADLRATVEEKKN